MERVCMGMDERGSQGERKVDAEEVKRMMEGNEGMTGHEGKKGERNVQ